MSDRWCPGITPSRPAPADLDTGVLHPARIYNYILGGKDNFAAGQAAAQAAEWRTGEEQQPRPAPVEASGYAAVARKN